MDENVDRRTFLRLTASSGTVALAGCNLLSGSDAGTPTAGPTGTSTARSGSPLSLSGRVFDPTGAPLAGGLLRLFADVDSATLGAGSELHEELARAEPDDDGRFVFEEFPRSEFDAVRSERDAVVVVFRHPDGWFLGGTVPTDIVFDSPSVLSTVVPVRRYLVEPTVAADDNGNRRGTVAVWQTFDLEDRHDSRPGWSCRRRTRARTWRCTTSSTG